MFLSGMSRRVNLEFRESFGGGEFRGSGVGGEGGGLGSSLEVNEKEVDRVGTPAKRK